MPSVRASLLVPLALLGALVSGLTACGSSKPAATTTASPTRSAPAAASNGARDRWGTVWLCRPGQASDPCLSSLGSTALLPNGSTRIERPVPAPDPPVDCFYVYPTISGQATINANLSVDFRELEVATAQASRFSEVCRVYAPVYRQITLSALEHPQRITLADALIAYRGVLAAFRDYLAHYNHGRGIVFIGHSQGAVILTKLLQQEVDHVSAVRGRLVSALLMGGNVLVPKGRSVGGDFAHIPACSSAHQTGCVVAYSSFTSKPANGSEFGRTSSDAGVSLLAPHKLPSDLRIMCVNPAAPAGGTAALDPYVPALVLAFLGGAGAPVVQTPWVSYPGQYSARCESSGDASWLQVTHVGRGGSQLPLRRLEDPALGLHIIDVNIALGNLVRLVGEQAAAYRRP